MFREFDLDHFSNTEIPILNADTFSNVLPRIYEDYITELRNTLNCETARSGNGGNKLRLYKTFKHVYETETYCKLIFKRTYRGAFVKFRTGTAPIAIELGWYNGLPVEERTCFHCKNTVEDEKYVLLHCPVYETIRNELLQVASQINNDFCNLSDNDKVGYFVTPRDSIS